MATCIRCNGSGEEPVREFAIEQWEIIDSFAPLGTDLRRVSRSRTPGGKRETMNVYRRIAQRVDEAVRSDIPKVVIAEALGISRVQLFNILRKVDEEATRVVAP